MTNKTISFRKPKLQTQIPLFRWCEQGDSYVADGQGQPAKGKRCYLCGLPQSKGREVLWVGHRVPVCSYCYDEGTTGRMCYAGSVREVMIGYENERRKPLTRKLTKEDRERQLVLKLGLP